MAIGDNFSPLAQQTIEQGSPNFEQELRTKAQLQMMQMAQQSQQAKAQQQLQMMQQAQQAKQNQAALQMEQNEQKAKINSDIAGSFDKIKSPYALGAAVQQWQGMVPPQQLQTEAQARLAEFQAEGWQQLPDPASPNGLKWVSPKQYDILKTGPAAGSVVTYPGQGQPPQVQPPAWAGQPRPSVANQLVPPEIQSLMQGKYQSADDFVADVQKNPATQKLLQQITSYKTDIGGGFNPAMKNAFMTAASVYDPSFDPSRFKGIQDAKTNLQNPDSPTGKNITALNTVMSHLDTLRSQFSTLQKNGKLTDTPAASAFHMWYANNISGDPDVAQAIGTQLPVITELDKALSNTSVQERIKQYQDVLRKYGLSDKQAFGLVQDFAGLVNKRLTVAEQRYENSLADSGVKSGDLRKYFWTPEGRSSYDNIQQSGGPTEFSTEEDVEKAAKEGKIQKGAQITIGGRPATWQ